DLLRRAREVRVAERGKINPVRRCGRRALRVDDRADAAGDAARVALEVGDLVDDRRPVEDALVVRVLLRERTVEARRLAGAPREVPRDVVGETVHVTRLAAV